MFTTTTTSLKSRAFKTISTIAAAAAAAATTAICLLLLLFIYLFIGQIVKTRRIDTPLIRIFLIESNLKKNSRAFMFVYYR